MNHPHINDHHLVGYINQIFEQYDVDHSGTLDNKQLTYFFNDINRLMGKNEIVTVQQTQQALACIDQNHDGRINKQELYHVFKQILQRQGFYVNGQNVWNHTGQNFQQAHQNWNNSISNGAQLPYYGNQNSFPTNFGIQPVMNWILQGNNNNNQQYFQQLVRIQTNRRLQILLQQQKLSLFDVPNAQQIIKKQVQQQLQAKLAMMPQQQYNNQQMQANQGYQQPNYY